MQALPPEALSRRADPRGTYNLGQDRNGLGPSRDRRHSVVPPSRLRRGAVLP